MTRLALIRHGHTPWNRAGRIQGRTDIPLDAEAEAELAKHALPALWNGVDLWSSPLARATQTAMLISGQTPMCDAALIEMNWGDWEGLKGKDLLADPLSGYRNIEAWGWDYTPPNGESPAALRERLVPWAQALERDAVAVCHIGVMRVLLAHAMGWNFDGPAPFGIKRNRLYIIHISDETWHADPDPVRLVEVAR